MGTVVIGLFIGFQELESQNLLLNGGFEEVEWPDEVTMYNASKFFASNWHRPSSGTVDLNRDSTSMSDTTLLYVSSEYVDANSGNYCAGFIALDVAGYLEHFTGELKKPLEKDSVYVISFYLRHFGSPTPFVSNGIGYKFSGDSLLFSEDKVSEPFYYLLFEKNKVYADFKIDEYVSDTTWKKYTSIYKASGGEKYITFGVFAYPDDADLFKQFKVFEYNQSHPYIRKQYDSNKLKYFKRINQGNKELDVIYYNYYLIDDVEVRKLTDDHRNIPRKQDVECAQTRSSFKDSGEIVVDRGFFGELTIELNVCLKFMEKYVLEYGKNKKLIIINEGIEDGYGHMKYNFKHPARKLRRRPVHYYIEKTSNQEIENIKSEAKKIDQIHNSNFKGLLIETH